MTVSAIRLRESTEPSTPPTDRVYFYYDVADSLFKYKNDAGVVSLFNSGITALNGLATATQLLATGSTGSDFNISSSGSTHTFHIPDAGATARGLITTGAQTLAGVKTLSSAPIVSTLVASRLLLSSATKEITSSSVTDVEAGYLSGVTSAIQTQLAAKQPLDAELTAIAGLLSAADKGVQFTGAGTAGTFDLTAAGRALLDDVAASDQRTTLGLGTLATQSGTFSGASSGTNTGDQTITLTGGVTGSGTGSFAATVVTNANLTGPITSVGNATTIADAELAAIAGLVSAADSIPYFTGAGTAALATFTAAGRALVDDADASAQRTTLGLVIGTDVQAYDVELAALAGLTSAADKLPYFTGLGTAALADLTTAGRALIAGASASAQRTTLGIGTGDSPTLTGLTLSSMTLGSVLFAGTSGAVTQDNANFFWDDTNNRLGIGTTSPGAMLQLNAGSSSTIGSIVKGAASQTANLTDWQNSAGTVLTTVNAAGNLLVGPQTILPTVNGTRAVFVKGTTGNEYGSLAVCGSGSGGAISGEVIFAGGLYNDGRIYTQLSSGGASGSGEMYFRVRVSGTEQTGFIVTGPGQARFGDETGSAAALLRANNYSFGAVTYPFEARNSSNSTDGVGVAFSGSGAAGASLYYGRIAFQKISPVNNTTVASDFLLLSSNQEASPTEVLRVKYWGGILLTQKVATSGSPYLLQATGAAHTTLTASTESPDVYLNLARTVQFATGAITTQRAIRIAAPTYAFVGASTISSAATVSISGAPIAGTNATITSAAALVIESGNVGIGTTSPFGRLDVVGTGGATGPALQLILPSASTNLTSDYGAIQLINTNTTVNNYSSLTFADTANGGQGAAGIYGVFTDHTNDYGDIAFATRSAAGYSEKVRITSAGNVGIGTKAPINTLSASPVQYSTGTASQSTTTVTGVGTTWTSAMVGSQFVFTNGTSAGIITAFGSTTSLTVSISQTVTSQGYTINYPGLNVTSTGNVGIGTTSPSTMVHVKGDAVNEALLRFQPNANGNFVGLEWTQANNTSVLASIKGNASTGEIRYNAAASYFPTFYAGGSEVMRILTTGNVGIGTTNPSLAKLQVQNSTTTGSFPMAFFNGSNNGVFFAQTGSTANYNSYGAPLNSTVMAADYISGGSYGPLALATGGASRLTIDVTGNVGIGSTSPGAMLQVNATAAGTIGSIIRGAASQSANLTEWQNSAGTVLSSVSAGGNFGINRATVTNVPLALQVNSTSNDGLYLYNASATLVSDFGVTAGGHLRWGFRNSSSTTVVTIATDGVSGGAVDIICPAAAAKGIVVKSAASRTAPHIQIQTSAGAVLGNVGGTMFSSFTDTSSTSTDGTENDLYSYTTVANTLAVDGESIFQREHVQFVASATATRRLRKYFAGTLIFDTGSLTLSVGGDFILETAVVRESSSVVRVSVSAVTTSASTIPYATYTRITGLTLTGTNILKTTGTAAGVGSLSGDIVNKMSKVTYEPTA